MSQTDKLHGIVIDDRQLTVIEIAKAAGISSQRVHTILREYLAMRKLSAEFAEHFADVF